MKELSYLDFSAKAHEKSLGAGAFVKAQYEITYSCNLHCVHCYTDPYNTPKMKAKELSFPEVTAILDKLHEENILWLSFTGGEIFMRKDFLKIYDYAVSKGFVITLFTNATMITEAIADHLAASPPFYFDITIYGASRETYEKVTQVAGSFDRFVRGVQLLSDRGLKLKIKTPLLTLNSNEVSEMRCFADRYSAPFRMSSLIYPRLNGDLSSCKYRLSATEILQIITESEEKEENCNQVEANNNADDSFNIPPSPSLYRCGCGKINAHIDPSGFFGTCTWARENRFKYDSDGVQAGMQKLAGLLQAKYYKSHSDCKSCMATAFCNKNPEMAVHETGDPELPVNHFCDVAYTVLDHVRKSGQ